MTEGGKGVLNNEEFHLEPGDVVQLDPETVQNKMFGACFLVVTEIKKPWGVQGYVTAPGHGQAYYRAEWKEMVYIGRAVWVVK